MLAENKFDPAFVARLRQARDLLTEAIELTEGNASKARPKTTAKNPTATTALDFSMPVRPFIKAHSAKMSGAHKFTLLVAYLCKGDEQKTVPLATVEKEWGRMTELLGKFNGAHTGRARNDDLVATEKFGFYKLRPKWKTILK